MRFDDFLHYIRHNSDADPLYLFDPYFAENVPEMDSAYKVLLLRTPFIIVIK